MCSVAPGGEALLSGRPGHPDWLQDRPQEGQRVQQEAEGRQPGSHNVHAGEDHMTAIGTGQTSG